MLGQGVIHTRWMTVTVSPDVFESLKPLPIIKVLVTRFGLVRVGILVSW